MKMAEVLHRNMRAVRRGRLGRACALAGWSLLLGVLWGCEPRPSAEPMPLPLSRELLIDAHNTNMWTVPDFKANLDRWQLRLVTQEQTRSFNEMGGTVVYRAPEGPDEQPMVYMRASAGLESKAWVAAANQEQYWWFSRRAKQAQWGYFRNIGKPCAAKMPFNPYTLLDFAGLLPLEDSAAEVTFKVERETYVVERFGRGAEGVYVERQYIFDRRTNLPVEVNAYGRDGQVVVHSEIGGYEALGAARVPTEILLSWPGQDSYLRLKLNRLKQDTKKRASLFVRTERVPGIDTFEQIDRQCE